MVGTREEAEQKLRQVLVDELIRALPAVYGVPQGLAQEIDVLRRSIVQREIDEIDLRWIGRAWEELVESIRAKDPAESLVKRYWELRDGARAIEMQIDELEKQSDQTSREIEILCGMLEKVKDALWLGNLDDAAARIDELSVAFSDIQRLRDSRLMAVEQMREKVREVSIAWDEIGKEFWSYGLDWDTVRQARSEIDRISQMLRNIWDNDSITQAQEKLSELERWAENARRERDARSARVRQVREMVARVFDKCPLCGEPLGEDGCLDDHWQVINRVPFPIGENGEEDAVLGAILADGVPVATLRVSAGKRRPRRGQVILWIADNLEEIGFEKLEYRRGVSLLSEEEVRALERRREIQYLIEGLEEEIGIIAEWRANAPDSLAPGAVFDSVSFRLGEYRGRKEWYAMARRRGKKVKLIVAQWEQEPEPGKEYVARVVKIIWDTPESAGCVVEIRDEKGCMEKLNQARQELQEANRRVGGVRA